MLFSGIPFLYYFLPVTLLVYFAMPRRGRNAVLLISSLIFYGWGEPKLLTLMCLTVLVFWLCGLAIQRAKEDRWKKLWLAVSVVFGIAMLACFKYADFFIGSLAALTGLDLPLLKLALPIGISFYTFQSISYTVDVYRRDVPAQKSLVNFGAYVALFPQLIAGPIVRYSDIAQQLESRSTTWDGICLGMRRFLMGMGKKVLLANNFGMLIEVFRSSSEPSVVFYWLGAIAYMLQIYFDFSGYSDMAIGLGHILGFRFPENFRHPFMSRSVTEFWRRWHMTLGGWFRDYVYIPLGGNRVSKSRWVFNILVVWMLTGLWHGAAWNFVLWGLMFALLLLLEKWLQPGRWPRVLQHCWVLGTVLASFVLFQAVDLRQAVTDFSGMLGLNGAPFISGQTLYALRSYGVLFAAGILGSTDLPAKLAARLPDKLRSAAEPVALAALLLVCTGYLVDGSFNPFLYFRF